MTLEWPDIAVVYVGLGSVCAAAAGLAIFGRRHIPLTVQAGFFLMALAADLLVTMLDHVMAVPVVPEAVAFVVNLVLMATWLVLAQAVDGPFRWRQAARYLVLWIAASLAIWVGAALLQGAPWPGPATYAMTLVAGSTAVSALSAWVFLNALRRGRPGNRRIAGAALAGLILGTGAVAVPLPAGSIAPLDLLYATAGLAAAAYAWVGIPWRAVSAAQQRLYDHINDGVIVLDRHHHVLHLNPAACEILGCVGEPVEGTSLTTFWPEGGDLLGRVTEAASEHHFTVNGIELLYSVTRLPLEGINGVGEGSVLLLQNITGREAMEQALKHRARELGRTNQLITDLAKVTTHLGAIRDPHQVWETLGAELRGIELQCAVISFNAEATSLTLRHLSLPPGANHGLELLARHQLIGHEVPRSRWPDDQVLFERSPIWYDEPIRLLHKMLPTVPERAVIEAAGQLGVARVKGICVLPLIAEKRVIGALPIWGADLGPEDSQVLSIFAGQVAGILNAADAHALEVQRTAALTRSNSMILALSRVAARLDSTTEFAKVVQTFGNELHALGIESLVGTVDAAKAFMRLEYTSVRPDVIQWAERLTGHTLRDLVISRRHWPTDRVITEGAPYWDPNGIRATLNVFPILSEEVHRRALQLAGIDLNSPVCYLPLAHDDDVIGVLAVWGGDLCLDDVPALTVFSTQLATAIRNARLLDDVQKRLNEKVVLLKEVHHRVKNNLQVISSLLNLQAARVPDRTTRDQLRESQNRVRSMALIHEKLYQSPNLADIDFAAYLRSLVSSLAQSYRDQAQSVQVDVQAIGSQLDLDTAIPCGLIVNELVSNALKHGFPEGRPGAIMVSLETADEDRLCLRVRDDGVGLPADRKRLDSSLGLSLVRTLSDQIGGTLTIVSSSGADFAVCFSAHGARQPAQA